MRTNLVKKKDTKSPLNDSMLDMVIAFDTTGSMNAYIKAVKLQVKELIPKLFKQNPDLRIGIVAFGDYCDMPSKDRFGKAYQVCELTDNENRLIEFITKAQSTSGGDSDEFYELVIKKIVEETNWREGSTKAVLLIADAEPHRVGYSYNDRIDKAKRQKKSMATAYKEALEFIQNNPVKDYIEGEDRVLRGYKMQFVSRDGKYKCMDMDIKRTGKETGERYVNINTISHLIYNGVKYVVE